MSKPGYQGILSAQIPRVELRTGVYARVIGGELNGIKGPAKTFTPVNVFDARLEADGRGELSLLAGQNSAIVLLRGDVVINGSAVLKGEAKIARLSPSGESVLLEARAESLLLVLSGEPINELVASYGPCNEFALTGVVTKDLYGYAMYTSRPN